MAQLCQYCRQQSAAVEHQFPDGRRSLLVCRSCRTPMLLLDHLGADGYTRWVEVVESYNAGNHAKVAEAVEKAISAVRDASGEETASSVRTAFVDILQSWGRPLRTDAQN